ncbi:hypothetical protein ACQEVI_05845 [Promicromonospora sp. CA-289599]|uniref:hypothetical protein n=1 Tax=Promicromonospora sp. CA-289599 TaxID=3240014 RepID=UPI003D8A9C02
MASLLTVFVREHADCIEGDASGIDVAMLVPSDNQSRTFGHLDELLHGVIANDPVTRRFNWSPGAIVRDRLTKRPERGELKPRAYKVDPRDVSDASVLLLDDTWTSGSSAASAAAALKAAGAHNVTVLTLGRQLNLGSNFGSTEAICHDRRGALWSRDRCVLCA